MIKALKFWKALQSFKSLDWMHSLSYIDVELLLSNLLKLSNLAFSWVFDFALKNVDVFAFNWSKDSQTPF